MLLSLLQRVYHCYCMLYQLKLYFMKVLEFSFSCKSEFLKSNGVPIFKRNENNFVFLV